MADVGRRRSLEWLAGLALSVVVAACSTSGSETTPVPTETTTAAWAGDVIEILPTGDAKSIIEAAEQGTVFEFSTGNHRVDSIEPRDRQHFSGASGAVLSGAQPVEGFEPIGDVWVAGGQTSEQPRGGTCATQQPRCDRPEDLFVDEEPLHHVDRPEAVTAGTWYFDYEADEIHLGSDPTGSEVELSTARYAFTGSAAGVVISGLTVEKFATPAQAGAIHAGTVRGG